MNINNMLNESWGETKAGLLEGLNSRQANIVAPLLENQKKLMLAENAAGGSTAAADIAGFRKILLPVIRRVIPGTIATELVGVQPMQGPVSQVYSLRLKYADEGTNGTKSIASDSEAFGNDHYSFASNPIYGFYSGGFGANSVATGHTPGAHAGFAAGSSGVGPGTPGLIGVDGTGALINNTGGAAGAQTGFSALDGCNVGGSGGTMEGTGGRRMTMEVINQVVEAGSRKLQASWSIEAMQDANNQHGLDIEDEMTKALSNQIVQDIDNEIITDLMSLAGTTATWAGDLPAAPGYYTPSYVGDRFANMSVMLGYLANEIGRKIRVGMGNFIVVPPAIVTVLQSAAKSVFAPATEGSFKGPNNSMLVGTLNGTIKVYSYLWNSAQATSVGGTGDMSILMGYKGGNGETEAGYFYCPYIPVQSSGVIVNPVTYQPVVSLMTRYGKTAFVNSNTSLGNSADYYAKLNVTDLSFA